LDYALPVYPLEPRLGVDGNVPSALADIRDVGRYVARVIADPRTLNKRVHVYNEVLTRNQVYDLVEKLSGEKLERKYVCLPILPFHCPFFLVKNDRKENCFKANVLAPRSPRKSLHLASRKLDLIL
jgi:nucleoside-diphosphate-sugar epimerase